MSGIMKSPVANGVAMSSSSKSPRTWSEVAYFALEQFKTQLTAFVGFPFIVATLLGAWHFLRPDLQAISGIVGRTAEIASTQNDMTKQLISLSAELKQSIHDMKGKQ